MKFLRHFLLLIICLCMLVTVLPPVSVLGAEVEEAQATDITNRSLVTDYSGIPYFNMIMDSKESTGWKTLDTAHLTLEYAEGLGSLYMVFQSAYGAYTVTNNDTGDTITAGEDLFIHEFVDLVAGFGTAPKSITITFDHGPAALYEMKVYTPGAPPASVQRWSQPDDGATDLILFATHSDDDQMFFAGLLPYYAVERGYRVQVVYLTTHYNTAPFRIHEMLNGLWAVGITAYPVFGKFPDFGTATTKEGAFREFAKQGWSQEELTGFVVEQLRRFKPLVAVGHDFNGEYGHAQHKVYAQLVADAVTLSNDAEAYPESAEAYGLWDVPKTYIHLYEENGIVMDFDQPMENFDGMTPYQVSKKLGFPCHASQQAGWKWYLNSSDTAAGIPHYSPCQYGLYRTSVGPDEAKNDMFENLVNYAEQERIAAEEEAARLEAERLAAEEEARLEAERLAAEEAARLEAERLAAEEAARQETQEATEPATQPQPEPEEPQDYQKWWLLGGSIGCGALLILILILLTRRFRYHGKYQA